MILKNKDQITFDFKLLNQTPSFVNC